MSKKKQDKNKKNQSINGQDSQISQDIQQSIEPTKSGSEKYKNGKRFIDFAGRRKIWYLISLLIIIPGIISLAVQGLNLGIDFQGGSLLHIRVSDASIDTAQVRSAVKDFGLEKEPGIQSTETQEFLIRTEELSQEQVDGLVASLQDKLGALEVLRHENVGAIIGKELTYKALYSLGIAALLILLYITVRFEFRYGLAALAALVHDGLIVTGIFSLLQIEVGASFVAAILTILGYSINDTIVIFDRIRENRKNYPKWKLDYLVNISITQTLARSINTVLTVIFCLVALLVFGGTTIKVFTLALLIGMLAGGYSSICVASPLWMDLTWMSKAR